MLLVMRQSVDREKQYHPEREYSHVDGPLQFDILIAREDGILNVQLEGKIEIQ
jgi:hypothetical protein